MMPTSEVINQNTGQDQCVHDQTHKLGDASWRNYESLKAQLTEGTTNLAEYEAACRMAAELAGV